MRVHRQAVDELVAEALAPATIRAYEADWQRFGGFCHAYGLDPADADGELVAAWVTRLVDEGLAVATLHRRLAAVTYAFSLVGEPSPSDAAGWSGPSAWRRVRGRHDPAPHRTAPHRTGRAGDPDLHRTCSWPT